MKLRSDLPQLRSPQPMPRVSLNMSILRPVGLAISYLGPGGALVTPEDSGAC